MTTDQDIERLRARLAALRDANAMASGDTSEDVAQLDLGMARILAHQLRQLAQLADRALTLDGRQLVDVLSATTKVREVLLSGGV